MSDFNLKDFYNTLPIALWRTSIADGTFLNANRHCAKLLGYRTIDELVKKAHATDFYVNPADRDKLLEEAAEQGVCELELPLIRKDGKQIWVFAVVRASVEEGYIEGSFVDITTTKLQERCIDDLSQIKNAVRSRLSEYAPKA